MNPRRQCLLIFVLAVGCARHEVVPIQTQVRDPSGASTIWEVHPDEGMASRLVGRKAYEACRSALAQRTRGACTVNLQSCMTLIITEEKHTLLIGDCRPSDPVMLVTPARGPGDHHILLPERPPSTKSGAL